MPTLAFGNYHALDAAGEPTDCCDDNELFRPDRHRRPATGRRSSSTPGLLRPLDAVQRLGPVRAARPAGQQRPALLRPGRRRGAALAHRARRGAAPVHRRRRLDAGPDRGMGIASYDLTGDGYPEVYLTSQGDNRLQTLDGRTGAADVRDIGARARRDWRPRRSPAATRCPRRPGTPSSRTSTTTASWTSSSQRATSTEQPDYATKDPEQPAHRPAGRHVRRGRRGRRHRRASRGAAGPRSSTSTSTACSTSSWSTTGDRRQAVAERRLRRRRRTRADGSLAGDRGSTSRGRTRRDRGMDRGQGRRPDARRGS